MTKFLPAVVQDLIVELEKIPGLGPKSAARMAYFFLRAPELQSKKMSDIFSKLREDTVVCESCHNVAETNPCVFCADSSRDSRLLCVVEEPLDVVAIERMGGYKGKYFVLGGVITPAAGIGPDDLYIDSLIDKVEKLASSFETEDKPGFELIFALSTSMEGDATLVYLVEALEEVVKEFRKKIKVTRLARGLSTGANLEHADSLTLKRALEGRTTF